jgi:hypothetical protein|nr:MAG TPA: hypothetical protein [Caudoviricetes sp.]
MYIVGICKKCSQIQIFDFTNMSMEEAIEMVSKTPMSECAGMHVEIGTWSDHYSFCWDSVFESKEKAESAVEFYKNYRRYKYGKKQKN